ncbi:MAG: hypothetical protein WAN12_03510 [Candidatus Acidiferrum sp.]
MKCRECLIQLTRSLAKSEMVPAGEDPPQRSDFIPWSELIANAITGGASAERVRGHLNTNLEVGFNPELPRPYVSECEECGWQSPEVD